MQHCELCEGFCVELERCKTVTPRAGGNSVTMRGGGRGRGSAGVGCRAREGRAWAS